MHYEVYYMLKKLLSRKFWYPILYCVLLYANRRYELGLTTNEVTLIGGTVASYIVCESVVDLRKY